MVPCSRGSADARADKKSGTCSSVSLVLRCAAHQTARPATYFATLRWETLSEQVRQRLPDAPTHRWPTHQAPADNGGIFLVIEATEGKSNGVSRAHASAAAIKLVEEPTSAAVDIRADYVAKNGAPSAAAPKIFFRYYLVDSSTGVKS